MFSSYLPANLVSVGFVGILLSLALLILFAYRGVSVVILAPLAALLAVAIEGSLELLPAFTQIFMVEMGGFIARLFPLFLLGSIFGKLLESSGFASGLAEAIVARAGRRGALGAIVLSCGLLTYGGVSAFVVCFTMVPLAQLAFMRAGISYRLVPGALALGALTFSMTCLPGTVQVHNLIPMPFFGTTPFAAPILGLLGGSLILALGWAWLEYRRRQEPYFEPPPPSEVEAVPATSAPAAPSAWICALPIAGVIALNWLFSESPWRISNWSFRHAGLDIDKVKGSWSMILSLSCACLLTVALGWKRLSSRLRSALEQAGRDAMLPVFNTGSEVGYGATIATLASFTAIKTQLFAIAPSKPLFTEWLSVNVLAGITGSASGGLSIALSAMAEPLLRSAEAHGVSPELLHRLGAMASGGLDSLPHNGAVITLLTVCRLGHRDSYKDIFVVSVLVPVGVTLAAVLWLG